MEPPRTNTCCFCYNLRVGAIIIGSLSMVNALSMLAFDSLAIFCTLEVLDYIEIDDFKARFVYTFSIALMLVNGALNIVSIYMSIYLLIGIAKGIIGYIKGFVIFKILMIVTNLFILLVHLDKGLASLIGIFIFYLGLDGYWTYVVFNYYKKLRLFNQPDNESLSAKYRKQPPYIQAISQSQTYHNQGMDVDLNRV